MSDILVNSVQSGKNEKAFKMLMVFLTLFVLLQLCPSDANTMVLKLEAEEGAFTGDTMMRSAASGGEVVVLKDGQEVSHIFSTESTCQVQVSNIRYSDGSSADICMVFVGNKNIGEFHTTSTDQWNTFYNSGTIGSTSLEMGQHLLTVKVNATDEFGVELDYMEVSIDCEEVATPGDSAPQGDFGLSGGEIAGIVTACITLLAAVISAGGACCYYLFKYH